MARKDITYHTNPARVEENTPLVTILETSVEKKQSTAVDSRQSAYVIDLARSAIGGIYYPIPGSQWYLKKIAGVWTLMSRAAQQNPQLDPALDPVPGDTYIGAEGTTYVVGDLSVTGAFTVGGGADPDIGTIKLHPTNTPPSGWLICDGTAVSRTTYSGLFGVIGTTFGVGDGSTTFNVPNLKGKVPVGYNSAETEFDAIGETGGAKTVALITAELPSHLHAVGTLVNGTQSASHTHSATGLTNSGITVNHTHYVPNVVSPSGSGSGAFFESWPGGSGNRDHQTGTVSADHSHNISGSTATQSADHTHTITGSTANTGSGTAHNNLQPYMALNFIIKALTSFIPPAAGSGATEDGFHAIGTSAASEGHTAKVVDDVYKRYIVRDDGKTEWGSGALTQDTNLYRAAADTLQTDDALRSNRTVAGDGAFAAKISTDTSNRLLIAADGTMSWGAGGVAAVDTNLYRSAADNLKTDDALTVGALTIGTVWVDPAGAATGHILRHNGTKYVSLAEESVAMYPNAVAANGVGSGVSTTSTSYSDMGPSLSFTKNKAGTKLRLHIALSFYSQTTAGAYFALQINGTDYGVTQQRQTMVSVSHTTVSGVVHAAGIGAGTYTVKLRWKSEAGNQVNHDGGDHYTMEVMEIK